MAVALSLSASWVLSSGCGTKGTTAPSTRPPAPVSRTWEDLDLTRSYAQTSALASFNGRLYAAGDYFDVAGWPRASFVAWDGGHWRIAGNQPNSSVFALAAQGGRLYAAGAFTLAGFDTLNYIGAWDGTAWHSVGGGMDWDVSSLAPFAGSLVAAGVFLHAGGVPAFHIASWDGTTWHPLGYGLDDDVAALVEYHGELIAGGYFTNAGGAPAHYIAAFTGTSWHPLGGASALNGVVRALYVHHDTLFAGGHFTIAGGVPAVHVACWTGAHWGSMGPGLGQYDDEPVTSFAAFDDHLIAGGAFFGGAAEWKAGLWYPMGYLTGEVDALGVSGARLYAGGYFIRNPGQPVGVARWVE